MKLLEVLKKKGLTYYQSGRYSLDNYQFENYQDEGEHFEQNKVFETDNRSGKFISINIRTNTSFFKYFLDGSRYSYKVADMNTTDHKFMPIIAGQIATGVCKRENNKITKYDLKRNNVLLLYHKINTEDFEDLKRDIEQKQINGVAFILERYQFHKNDQIKPENLAIAKLQKMMMDMEIEMLTTMVNSGTLKPHEMLVIDGSLQFMDKKADDRLFANVIGISKSFNPNLQGLLRKQSQQIATILTKLEFGQRTPVYKYPLKNNKRIIGAWYLRIREKKNLRNPLDGIVKVEKIAVTEEEKEDGFETGLIDNISQAILLERNPTSYGKEDRWANHIYPMYLTEKMIKESFLSETFFLNIF